MKRETKDSKLLKELKEALDEDQGSDVEDATARAQKAVQDALDKQEGSN